MATLNALSAWWHQLNRRRPSLAEARHAHRVNEPRRPVGYQIGPQAHHLHPTNTTTPARYTLDALVPKATYAPIATFNTLTDALGTLADAALPRARRHTTNHTQIQQAHRPR